MPPLKAEQTPDGQRITFAYDTEHPIEVEFSTPNPKDELNLSTICAYPKFVEWVNLYSPRPDQRLKLTRINFHRLVYQNDEIDRIELTASGIRTQDNLKFSSSMIICGSRAAVLIVLRVSQEGSGGGSATVAAKNVEGERPVRRSRDYIVFIKHPRLTIGAPELREIPCGTLDSDGRFCGSVADLLREAAQMEIRISQLLDMSSLALPPRWSGLPRHSLGVALDPELLDERVKLMLYRENVDMEFITKLQEAAPRSNMSIDVSPLNEAWRLTSDAKTFSALFLFHELRPKYKAPREIKTLPIFTSIDKLNPASRGFNLRVKVVTPAVMANHPMNITRQVAQLVVGDGTGSCLVRLSSQQMVTLTKEVSSIGNPLVIRNANIDMSGGHITIITDRFGKISFPTEDETVHFNFEPNTSHDISAAEYEEGVDTFASQSVPPLGNRNFGVATGGGGEYRRGGEGMRGRGRRRGGRM